MSDEVVHVSFCGWWVSHMPRAKEHCITWPPLRSGASDLFLLFMAVVGKDGGGP